MASFFSFSTKNYVEIVRGGTRICLQLLSSLQCVRRPSCRTDVDDIIIRICSSRERKPPRVQCLSKLTFQTSIMTTYFS